MSNQFKNLLKTIHGEDNPSNGLKEMVGNCEDVIKELEDLIHKEEAAQKWATKTQGRWNQPKKNVPKELKDEATKAKKNIEHFHKVCPELKHKLKEMESRLKRLGVNASNILNSSSKRTRKQSSTKRASFWGGKKTRRKSRKTHRR